jgi:hypothetical protein
MSAVVLDFDKGQRVLRSYTTHLTTLTRRRLRDPNYKPPAYLDHEDEGPRYA